MSKISVMIDRLVYDKLREEIKAYAPFSSPDNTIDELTEISINIKLAQEAERYIRMKSCAPYDIG